MASIQVNGEGTSRAVVSIREPKEDERGYGWRCLCRATSEREFWSLADVIADAEVHADIQCPRTRG